MSRLYSSANQILLSTTRLRVGRFRAPTENPLFEYSGPPGEHLIVFPETSVLIEHQGSLPFTADRNTITFYNPDQEYRRTALSPKGDISTWIALRPAVLRGLLEAAGASPSRAPSYPFYRAGSSDSHYFVHALIRAALRSDSDPALVEDLVMQLCRKVIGDALSQQRRSAGRTARGRQSAIVEGTRRLLAATYQTRLSLREIADAQSCSPYYLCRLFKSATGLGISAYRRELRLRAALNALLKGADDLLSLAIDVGFASHAHFTAEFRKAFGHPPSVFRDRVRSAPGHPWGSPA